ncbi:heavy metal-associated isoprenylated plant protein 39-like isoform X2 [Cornus florida]|uniref:heavy metal-associated isoprenylated plant protein 39-like isoform X2 n=1 Tax=Cornus florida TaxID=4283 RepID=UPI00289939E2|nr:heavy metal-associated isoprenylated plant protein 39-like isoform X2 [Cornus florida]
MKKVELKLWLYNEKDNFFNFRKIYEKANCFKNDEKAERKAMKAVSSLAVAVVKKLRKSWHTDVLSVGEPDKKKEEPKKEDGKKEEPKKVEFKPIPYPVYSFPSAEEYPNASICAIL